MASIEKGLREVYSIPALAAMRDTHPDFAMVLYSTPAHNIYGVSHYVSSGNFDTEVLKELGYVEVHRFHVFHEPKPAPFLKLVK